MIKYNKRINSLMITINNTIFCLGFLKENNFSDTKLGAKERTLFGIEQTTMRNTNNLIIRFFKYGIFLSSSKTGVLCKN